MYDEKFLKNIMERVEKDFLKNEKGYIVSSEYELFKDVIILYAKQHNLLESTLLLLENRNTEEAYILARALINNYFMIGYLLNDNLSRKRLKQYHGQPIAASIAQLKNMKKVLKNNTFKKLSKRENKESLKKIDEALKYLYKQREEYKKENGEKLKILRIVDLATNCDELGLALYTGIYMDASKYEHSDITSLEVYKKKVLEEYSNDYAFILDMNSSNEKLKDEIYKSIELIYLDTYLKIFKYIIEKQKHLLINYDEKKLYEISSLIQLKLARKKLIK